MILWALKIENHFLYMTYIGLRHRRHVAGQPDLTGSSDHVDDSGPCSDERGVCEHEHESGRVEYSLGRQVVPKVLLIISSLFHRLPGRNCSCAAAQANNGWQGELS